MVCNPSIMPRAAQPGQRHLLGRNPIPTQTPPGSPAQTGSPAVRIDKWLWAARLYKTRSLASEAVSLGRVQINGQDVKPARELKVGDLLRLRQGPVQRELVVKGMSHQRGPAPVAQRLYEETPLSIQSRAEAAERARLAPEPAATMEHGRPTKQQRRDLQKGWDKRWSASVDD